MSIIWRIIGAVSIILARKKEIPDSIIRRFWSIIDSSLNERILRKSS